MSERDKRGYGLTARRRREVMRPRDMVHTRISLHPTHFNPDGEAIEIEFANENELDALNDQL